MSTPTTMLPVVDLTSLREGHGPGDAPAVLDAACRDLGFFLVEGHGINQSLRTSVLQAARQFFALPTEVKERVSIAGSGSAHRGFVAIAAETLDPSMPGDAKECFDIATDHRLDHPEVLSGTALHGANRWPDLPGFRSACEAYFAASMDAASLLLRALALALDLEEHWFTSKMGDSISYLRLLHYPPVEVLPGMSNQPGCGAHTDYGLVTLLAEDEVGGLQVCRRDGTWLDIRTEPGQLVVNLGDLLARWTNHRYVSTPHRVVRPKERDRYSLPVFVNTAYRVMVECLPTCIDAEHPWPYEPVSVGDYLVGRFDDTHSYRSTDT